MNDAEKNILEFYNSGGWDTNDGVTEDAMRWEDLRGCAKNKLGGLLFSFLFYLEERYPSFFVKHFEYPMIILTKI